ncbi:MAG: DUF4956 domain-containing protein [Bacteroidales bacterium]|nr:DUF4956 domain-containing protein [Bacteroidales bacterium]
MILQTDIPAALDLTDDNLINVQTITDAMMTTSQSLTELGIRFFLNLLVCWILVRCFYFPKSRRRDYYFTFMVFSSAMLLLLFMMGNAEVGVGLTLGLFAIFGVIRYRTETVPIREMTYLFIIIAVAAVNGLSPLYKIEGITTDSPHYQLSTGHLAVLLVSNLLAVALVGILESSKALKQTATRLILYDRIDLIVPEKRELLKADLEQRVGVAIDKLEIGHVDFLRDAAFIKIYYNPAAGEPATIGELTRAKDFTE